ncbi:MAG: DNA polymerase III subunit gamma/tau [Bacteroidetes bacterium]|nr:DNA polymerase III subunit gamma/tau [Bacteroidota bacterium]
MENFVVSARKYRPATFNTVVGQASITNTLKNAIKNHHLAQAFLFCGPRGVGKTTCARILAKTINCQNLTENTEACDKCESCKSFNSGQSLNVYELDAASNNSVDDIRNLVDQVRFAPQLGNYKVYIIDEVHMLSQAAFNAFLKTLEEPPKHAIFILATTEKHKIIPTILSRCQIFDFNRIQVEDIASHLAFIAKSENITADADALHIIAQKADGALRDACSIFDQIVSFAGNNLTYKAVIDNLNILDYDYYFKVTDALITENIPAALLLFNEILNNGFDGHNFITGLGEHLRNLLVCKDASTLSLLEVSANIKDKYKEQSGKCPQLLLLRGLNIINRCDTQYKSSKNHRLQVELALMQLCSINTPDTEKKNDSIKVNTANTAIQSDAPPAKTTTTASTGSDIPGNNGKSASVNAAPASTAVKTTPTPTAAITSPTVATIKKPGLKTSSPSINQFINQTKTETKKITTEANEAAPDYEKPAMAFSQEILENTWNLYAKNIQQKGKINLYSTLSFRKPLLKENFIIEFTIENKVQQEVLEQERLDLLSFLRKELNNYSINLKTIINTIESERKPYTTGDKFKRMAEKNPAINKLKQLFDLDIDG